MIQDDGGSSLTKSNNSTISAAGSAKETWERNFALLKSFEAEHGHCRVLRNSTNKLSLWVDRQRKAKKKDKLSFERVRRLERLGFLWSVTEQQWEQSFNVVLLFLQHHGHCRIPLSFTLLSAPVGRWLSSQRKLARRRTLLVEREERTRGVYGPLEVEQPRWNSTLQGPSGEERKSRERARRKRLMAVAAAAAGSSQQARSWRLRQGGGGGGAEEEEEDEHMVRSAGEMRFAAMNGSAAGGEGGGGEGGGGGGGEEGSEGSWLSGSSRSPSPLFPWTRTHHAPGSLPSLSPPPAPPSSSLPAPPPSTATLLVSALLPPLPHTSSSSDPLSSFLDPSSAFCAAALPPSSDHKLFALAPSSAHHKPFPSPSSSLPPSLHAPPSSSSSSSSSSKRPFFSLSDFPSLWPPSLSPSKRMALPPPPKLELSSSSESHPLPSPRAATAPSLPPYPHSSPFRAPNLNPPGGSRAYGPALPPSA